MALKLITAPSIEPVTTTILKAYMRIDGTDMDTLLTSLLAAARSYAENFQNRAYLTQTWELTLDDFPSRDIIELARPPLASVTTVKYTSVAGVEATWAAANYIVDTDSTPGRICLADGISWPSDELQPINGVKIRYTAGATAASAVSENVKLAIMAHVAYFFDNPTGDSVPPWVDRLLSLERLVPI